MRYLFFPILVSIYGLNCTSKQPRVALSFPLFSPNFLLCGHVPFKRQTVMVIVVVGNNANRDHGSVHSGGWFARRETYLVLIFMASSSHFLTFHHFKETTNHCPLQWALLLVVFFPLFLWAESRHRAWAHSCQIAVIDNNWVTSYPANSGHGGVAL